MARQSSSAPRRQRKALYNADSFHRRRRMSVPLSRELRARFHCRSVPVRKGDTVRILSGSYVGSEERVARVDRRSYSVILNNITLKTGEQKQKPLPIRTGQLLLTKLNLSDAWRRRILSVREEELTPEELGTAPEAPATQATEGRGAMPDAGAVLPGPEGDMHLTAVEREFLEDATTEDEAPKGTASKKATPEEAEPKAPRGEMKLTAKETAFFESAEKEEYGPNAKAVRTHKKAPGTAEEEGIAGETEETPEPSVAKPHPSAKPRGKSPPPKENDA